jgi:hypothetical protein
VDRLQETGGSSFSVQEDDMPNRITAVITLSLLACAALWACAGEPARAWGPPPGWEGGPRPRVDILVDGVPQAQYAARGTRYVEALKGREYAIRLTNPYPVRVGVALAVDGLNTIDARHTSAAQSRKWVLGPYETVVISGWQTSLSHARQFTFTTEERSYGQSLGQIADLGVISAVYFRERADLRAKGMMPLHEASPQANESRRRDGADAPAASGAAAPASPAPRAAADEYAATGMGRATDHAVQAVSLDLEQVPTASISLRYEFRPQLVRLGVLPAPSSDGDPLARREGARGFEPGFCPDPKRYR